MAIKLNRFVISMAMLTCSMHVMAGDSLEVQQTKFEKRLERKQNAWLSLIPTHFVIQNAGNMGTLSAGIGWSYGKSRKWETELLVGFIPNLSQFGKSFLLRNKDLFSHNCHLKSMSSP